jgi:predicted transposase YdaD
LPENYQPSERAIKTVALLRQVHEEGRTEGRAEGHAEGHAKGRAETLLLILAARGLEVSAKERERILGCTDCALLDGWIERALSASSTSQILG